jgi:hypothetical protein
MNKVQELKDAGYLVHVAAITAKKSLVDSRGQSRADYTGKSYSIDVDDWKGSISAFVPMIASVNGLWTYVENIGNPKIVLQGEGGDANRECSDQAKVINPFMPATDCAEISERCTANWAETIRNIKKEIEQHQAEIDRNALLTDHLPLCESFGIKVPTVNGVNKYLDRSLTPEEFEDSDRLAGVLTATPQKKPIALWLMGSSAVGKSTASKTLLDEYGIPLTTDPKTGKKNRRCCAD